MKERPQVPKKVALMFEALPLLALVLPFVGQQWNERTWSFSYFLLFIPYFARYASIFSQKGKMRFIQSEWPFFWLGYFMITQVMGSVAFTHRAHPGEAIRDALITLFLLSLGILLARYFKAKNAKKLNQWNQKMGFELIPEQTKRAEPNNL